MSVLQLEELVTYQLRSGYLNELADGVGERLFTLNEGFLNSGPFKVAGWRPNPSHIKRIHSPPIPTAIAAEYFQAPRLANHTLEDGIEDDALTGGAPPGGFYMGGERVGGAPTAAANRRRRRREEDDDSSDLTDDSDEEQESRASQQQIRFAKVPVRNRAGSSPLSNTVMRPGPVPSTSVGAPRRGSHSALKTVNEAARGTVRRDTITSSEASDLDVMDGVGHGGYHRTGSTGGARTPGTAVDVEVRKLREAARAAARAAKLQAKLNAQSVSLHQHQHRAVGGAALLEEFDSDASDASEGYGESIDSASILDLVENASVVPASPTKPVVGTPPRNFVRRPTIRQSQPPQMVRASMTLPPPRPMSMIRPLSTAQPPVSMLSSALDAAQHQAKTPFQRFAALGGAGLPRPVTIRIWAPFSSRPREPFEVLIRPTVMEEGGKERYVTVTELIGLSLYRYIEERLQPPLPADRLNLNWWTLRMIDQGEVDDDFPPLDRAKPLSAFTVSAGNNPNPRAAGRTRSNSKAYDEFALVQASQAVFAENQRARPEEDEKVAPSSQQPPPQPPQQPPQQHQQQQQQSALLDQPMRNPILHTTFRSNAAMLADRPQPQNALVNNSSRGQQKLLRIHIIAPDLPAGQMVALNVTTEMYLAEVLDQVCWRRQLDRVNHVLKLPSSGAVAMLDRPVSSIGALADLELHRRRFAPDGSLGGQTTSAGGGLGLMGSPSSSPRLLLPYGTSADAQGASAAYFAHHHGGMAGAAASTPGKRGKHAKSAGGAPHPLTQELMRINGNGGLDGGGKRYTVWRKQTMRIVALSERMLIIDGEYIHIVPASGGKPYSDGKATTVHFSNLLGCKITRRHPTNFKLTIYKTTDSNKRYEFESKSAEEAAEIIDEIKKGIAPYRDA